MDEPKKITEMTTDELWIIRGREQEVFEQCQRNIAAVRQELALRQDKDRQEIELGAKHESDSKGKEIKCPPENRTS